MFQKVSNVRPQRFWIRTGRVLVALLPLLGLSGCNWFGYRSWEWHQKMTISVMTPEGVKTGSSVVTIAYRYRPMWLGFGGLDPTIGGNVFGESAVVDLGSGRYLISLLSDEIDANALASILDSEKIYDREPRIPEWAIDQALKAREVKKLSPKYYPYFVTFGDILAPGSLQLVDPKDLEATFGPGYALQSITIEVTDEPVTEGRIGKLIPCLDGSPPCSPVQSYMKKGGENLNSALRYTK